MPATGKEAVSLKQAKAMYDQITNDLTDQTDSKIQDAVDGKLDAEDIVAGKNISVTHDPESGKVTIDNTMKLVDSASGYVAHGEDAYAQKPIEVRIKGRTVKNLWPVINGTSNGITVSTDETGLHSVEPENLVTSGKNLVDIDDIIDRTVNDFYDPNHPSCPMLPPGAYIVSADIKSTIEPFGLDITVGDDTPTLPIYNTAEVEHNGRVSLSFTLDARHTQYKNIYFRLCRYASRKTYTYSAKNIQLELGSTATAYEPPNVTTTPLPEVELRSLPNGTCDELVIKADGTCEVERKTGTFTFNGSENWAKDSATGGTEVPYFSYNFAGTDEKTPVGCWGGYNDRLPTENPYTYSEDCFYIFANGNGYIARLRKSGCDDVTSIKEWLASNNVHAIYGTVNSTEPQTPVTRPVLPAPTFNAYHDSDVPSNTSVEYLTEDAKILSRFLMPGNIKAGSNVSVDVEGNDVTVSSSGGTGDVDTATDEEFKEYMGY